jgi:hypothetical protein
VSAEAHVAERLLKRMLLSCCPNTRWWMTNAAYVAEELRVKADVANTRRRKPHVNERYQLQNCLSPWLHSSSTPPSSTSSP